jgi:hypothetical protein
MSAMRHELDVNSPRPMEVRCRKSSWRQL